MEDEEDNLYVIEDEDLMVEVKEKEKDSNEKSAEKVFSEAIANKKGVKIIGDSMIRDVCKELEHQSENVIRGISYPGAKIGHRY